MSIEENSLRKDLEAAFEQHTKEPEHKEAGGPSADAQEPIRNSQAPEGERAETPAAEDGGESGQDTSGRDEKGRFKSGDPSKPEAPQQATAKPAAAPAPEQQPQTPPKEELAAPIGWKAGAREHWKTIPRAAQEEIIRRDKETSQALRQSSTARKLAEDFQQTVNPFLPLIQAQNSNPLQAVKNLMTTAAGLTVGTAMQKAQIVREIIQNYGVDIQTLDQVLSGQPVQQGGAQQQQNLAPPPWAQPIFQFMNTVQQSRQQREEQMRADADAETEAFAAKHEFFEDVRQDMADIMDVAAQRGKVISIEDAYKRALIMNPEIDAVVKQREAAKRAQTSNIQQKRNAASSISGAPKNGPTGVKNGEESRRAAIEEAWDAQMGR